MNDNKENHTINFLEITPETKTSYSNLVVISSSRSEFVIDFASFLPGYNGPRVSNRIIMTTVTAKRLFNALFDNISKHEAQFGLIDPNENFILSNGFDLNAPDNNNKNNPGNS